MTDNQIKQSWQAQLEGKFRTHHHANVKNTLKRRGLWRMVKDVINLFV